MHEKGGGGVGWEVSTCGSERGGGVAGTPLLLGSPCGLCLSAPKAPKQNFGCQPQTLEGEEGGLGGGGGLRGGKFSHAVLNLLWEISHPHAVSRPLVGGGCCHCYLLMLCS